MSGRSPPERLSPELYPPISLSLSFHSLLLVRASPSPTLSPPSPLQNPCSHPNLPHPPCASRFSCFCCLAHDHMCVPAGTPSAASGAVSMATAKAFARCRSSGSRPLPPSLPNFIASCPPTSTSLKSSLLRLCHSSPHRKHTFLTHANSLSRLTPFSLFLPLLLKLDYPQLLATLVSPPLMLLMLCSTVATRCPFPCLVRRLCPPCARPPRQVSPSHAPA